MFYDLPFVGQIALTTLKTTFNEDEAATLMAQLDHFICTNINDIDRVSTSGSFYKEKFLCEQTLVDGCVVVKLHRFSDKDLWYFEIDRRLQDVLALV